MLDGPKSLRGRECDRHARRPGEGRAGLEGPSAKRATGPTETTRRCLTKEVTRRLQAIGDARIELDDSLGETRELPETESRVAVRRKRRRLGAAAVVLTAAVSWMILHGQRSGAPAGNNSLAVLPFRNMTNLPEGELLGLAMADTVSVRLANVPGLQVVTPGPPSKPERTIPTSPAWPGSSGQTGWCPARSSGRTTGTASRIGCSTGTARSSRPRWSTARSCSSCRTGSPTAWCGSST